MSLLYSLLFFNFLLLLAGLAKNLSAKIIFIFSFLLLTTAASFFREGFDAEQYAELFYSIPQSASWIEYYDIVKNTNYEYGFVVVMAILAKFEFSHQTLFFVYSSISIYIILFVAKIDKKLFVPTVIIYSSTYYLWNEHVQMRQGLASSFFLLAIYFLLKNRTSFFFVSGILSFLSHRLGYSFPILLIMQKIFDRKSYWVLIIASSFLLGKFIGGYNLFSLLDYLSLLHWKLYDYMISEAYTGPLALFSFRVLKSIIIAYLILYFWHVLKWSQFYFLLSRIYLIGASIQFILIDFYIMSIRISQFFMVAEIFLIPFILRCLFPKTHLIFSFFVSYLFLMNAIWTIP